MSQDLHIMNPNHTSHLKKSSIWIAFRYFPEQNSTLKAIHNLPDDDKYEPYNLYALYEFDKIETYTENCDEINEMDQKIAKAMNMNGYTRKKLIYFKKGGIEFENGIRFEGLLDDPLLQSLKPADVINILNDIQVQSTDFGTDWSRILCLNTNKYNIQSMLNSNNVNHIMVNNVNKQVDRLLDSKQPVKYILHCF